MNENNTVLKTDRRKFISTVIPSCAFSCLGIKSLIAADQTELLIQDESKKHKFQKEWGHTYEEAFRWKFNWITCG